VTRQLAQDLAAFLPEAHLLSPADLSEPAQPEPNPQTVDVDVDFGGVPSTLLKSFSEDSVRDSLSVYYSPWTKAFKLSWRGHYVDGVVAVRATDDGLLVTTNSGSKLVRPVDGAKAEVVDLADDFETAPGGAKPTSSLGEDVSAFFDR
jgi:hypothetical protein